MKDRNSSKWSKFFSQVLRHSCRMVCVCDMIRPFRVIKIYFARRMRERGLLKINQKRMGQSRRTLPNFSVVLPYGPKLGYYWSSMQEITLRLIQ